MDLEDYFAIPYRLVAYSAVGTDGSWRRYAEYPEIGCIGAAATMVEAMELADDSRLEYILTNLSSGRGQSIPIPRPPLQSLRESLPSELRDRLKAEMGQHTSGSEC
jgi:hypothetical protein